MHHRQGQGLLEVIVAFAVIGLGLGGALALLLTSGVANRQTAERTIAANLAREAIEVVRSIRDSNGLQGLAFDAGLFNGTDGTAVPIFQLATGWSVSFTPNSIGDASAVVNQVDTDANGIVDVYTQAPGGAPTPYRRLITFRAICDTAGVITTNPTGPTTCASGTKVGLNIQVLVQWTTRGSTTTIDTNELLYDWHP